jgi:hypothetical protein
MNSQPPGTPGPTVARRVHGWRWVPVVLVAAALSAASCSSSNGSPPQPNLATAKSDIQTLYTTYFNLSDKSVPAKLALMQDGASLKAGEVAAIKYSKLTSATGAIVQSVKILSDSACAKAHITEPCALVNYNIIGTNGGVPLPKQLGYAVYLDGHWLVSKATTCGLFALVLQTLAKPPALPACTS